MLLTYADTALKHTGGLYRAANWDYDGMTGKNPIFWDPIKERMVSRKKGKNTYGKKAILFTENGKIWETKKIGK